MGDLPNKLCSVDGCKTPPRRAGMCGMHHQRKLRHGDPLYCPRVDCEHPGCVTKVNPNKGKLCAKHSALKQNLAYHKRNPEWSFHKELARHASRMGLDGTEVVASYMAHDGLCDICGRPPGETGRGARLHIDHDHNRPGVFRGWLCSNCNRGIGYLGDDPSRLESAAGYLRKAA